MHFFAKGKNQQERAQAFVKKIYTTLSIIFTVLIKWQN